MREVIARRARSFGRALRARLQPVRSDSLNDVNDSRCYVLLTDSDDAWSLVQCDDRAEAERVGEAAMWSNGGVSAWLIPARTLAVLASDNLVNRLRDGEGVTDAVAGLLVTVVHLVPVSTWHD